MRIAVYPGSFDPATNGHMDIISRASVVFDKLIVGVLHNPEKACLLSVDQRVTLLKKLTQALPNVEVHSFNGLLVDFVEQSGSNIIVRGFRAISDFEYEMQLAQTNAMLNNQVETVFLVSKTEYVYISSSMVRQLYQLGADYSKMVPAETVHLLEQRRKEIK